MQTRKNSKLNLEEKEKEEVGEEEEEGEEEEKVDSLHTVFLELYPELIAYPCLFKNRAKMLKFGPFSGHFDYLARIRVLARNFGSTGSSVTKASTYVAETRSKVAHMN